MSRSFGTMSPCNWKVRVFILLVQASFIILVSSNVLDSDSFLNETTTKAARKHIAPQRIHSTPLPKKSTIQTEPSHDEAATFTTLKPEQTTISGYGEAIDSTVDEKSTIAFNYSDVTTAPSVDFGNGETVTEEAVKLGVTEDYRKMKGAPSRASGAAFYVGPKYILFVVLVSGYTKFIRIL